MEKSLKTKLTKERIINAAIVEFGNKSYEEASINTICKDNNISKGLIYHNYKDKDDLYLSVVKIVYKSMKENFDELNVKSNDINELIAVFMEEREAYFGRNILYRNIFFRTIFSPPKHLEKKIREIRNDYETGLKNRYTKLLKKSKLKDGVSVEDAVEYILIFQEGYNSYFEKYLNNNNLDDLINIHENKIRDVLKLALYGILENR